MFENLFNSEFGDKLQKGVDYYMDPAGFRIMTEFYLAKRGYCCSNGCRHCPYSPKAVKGNRRLRAGIAEKYNLA
jgi:hypothetical protein